MKKPEEVKVSPELQEKANKASEQIKKILEENGLNLSIEFIYQNSGISAKPVLIEAPIKSPLKSDDLA